MKQFTRFKRLLSGFGGAALALTLLFASQALTSCKEDVSADNYAISTDQTVTDYLKSCPQFTLIESILERVKLGRSDDASSLSSVMSARGNYTVFAPNDSAVTAYIQGLGVTSIDELTYEQAQNIAMNCIIDNGDDAAYETADFPTPGAFTLSNLNDRTLTCAQDASGDFYIINGTSTVVAADHEVSNGMVHEVSTVISPAADNLADRIADADNLKIFSAILNKTTWCDSLTAYRDNDYEKENYQEITDYRLASETSHVIRRNTHRYIGFTALVEPDEVLEAWGITATRDANGDITDTLALMQQFEEKCAEIYGTAEAGNYSHPDNAVNQFVAYHLMYGSMAYNKFVRHLNEYNYLYGPDIKNPQTTDCPTNVWNYYTTMGQHPGLIKIVQVGDAGFEQDKDHKIYANRISEYDNGRKGDYHETAAPYPGILISEDNGEYDNNAQNGFYFPINQVLLFDQTTCDNLASERMRIELCTMLPEMQSNNNRGGDYRLYPLGYFDNILNESSDTKIVYVCDQGGGGWNDYQGDEFLFCGLYDFTLRLPPVPKSGTYEIRMGVGMNPMRGMAQIYFGNDPYRLSPAGLPYDMRQTVNESNTEIPWVADSDDEETNIENDKNMRNHGYMKGPMYFTITDGKGETPVRNRSGSVACVRRIITNAYMEKGKYYYLRFKSALKKLDSQFFLDYFEIVPTSVYNGVEEEDIW